MTSLSSETLDYANPGTDNARTAPLWRRIAAIALLLLGFAVYLNETVSSVISQRASGNVAHQFKTLVFRLWPLWLVAILGAICVIPRIHRPVARALDGVRHPNVSQRRITSVLILLAAAFYFGFTAWRQHRDFNMRTQDEFMLLVQVQALAAGHLYMPSHPMADFFETFYILNRPIYSSMYFPGGSMFFVPATWLHLPPWFTSLLVCGAVVAMTYRVVTELTDAIAGSLAALLVVGITTIRTLSLMIASYMPMALLMLLMVWAYLHWRKSAATRRRLEWAALIGALAGWSAITRPLDSICLAGIIAVAMLIDMIGPSKEAATTARPPRLVRALKMICIAVACAAPFLAIQLKINHAVTGHFGQTPVQAYYQHYWPDIQMGLYPRVLPGARPAPNNLQVFKDNYKGFVIPLIRRQAHRVDLITNLKANFAALFEWTLPNIIFICLIPVSVLGLIDRRRTVFWIILPLFPALYVLWIMFIKYYTCIIAPVVAYSIVLGAVALVETFPRQRAFLSTWLTASIALLALLAMPELSKNDKPNASDTMQTFNRLSATLKKPAVVFFRYDATNSSGWRHEQTYNAEAAWIDDEPVIRAQDLEQRNIELVNYYAKVQPNRTFYLFDQRTWELRLLGSAAELAAHPETFEAKMVPSTLPSIHPATTRAAEPAQPNAARRHRPK